VTPPLPAWASAELVAALRAAPWRWAKTYAQTAPHYYLVARQDPELVLAQPWRDGRRYRYLELDGWKYWYLTPVLNRERLTEE